LDFGTSSESIQEDLSAWYRSLKEPTAKYGIYHIIHRDMPKVLKGDFGMPWGSMPCGDSKELRIAEASFVNRNPRVLKHADRTRWN
jgi:hypothetical protein